MDAASPVPSVPAAAADAGVTRTQLFLTFLKVGVLGFGGVMAWVRRIIVEERRWMDDRDFAELFGVASVLPGANTVNVATMLGDRYGGASGVAAALAGLIVTPLLILAGVAALYERYAALPEVRGALGFAAAATAGLVIGNALKMMRNLRPGFASIGVFLAIFAAIGFLHLPLLWTLVVMVPASFALLLVLDRRF